MFSIIVDQALIFYTVNELLLGIHETQAHYPKLTKPKPFGFDACLETRIGSSNDGVGKGKRRTVLLVLIQVNQQKTKRKKIEKTKKQVVMGSI
jgi:hypothetical protein